MEEITFKFLSLSRKLILMRNPFLYLNLLRWALLSSPSSLCSYFEPDYSSRSATSGSMPAARRAGR